VTEAPAEPAPQPPRASRAVRGLANVALLAACALPVARLHPVYLRQFVGVGQGAFEPGPEGAILRYGDHTTMRLFPSLSPGHGSELLAAPGTTLIVPVDDHPLEVRGANAALAPWIVLGEEGPDVVSRLPKQVALQGHRLASGRVLAAVSGRMELRPWEPLAPWTADRERLRALRSACGDGVLHVERAAGEVVLRLGSCRASAAVGSAPVRLAVAGDAVVERPGLVWPVREKAIPPLLALTALLLAAQLLAFGLRLSAFLALLCAAAWPFAPELAAFAWILIGLQAEVVLLWQAGRRIARGKGLPRAAIEVSAAVALVLAGLATSDSSFLHPRAPTASPTGGRSDCLVIGYSTAGNATLPDASLGIDNYLDRSCSACAGRTGTLSESGQAFGWVAFNVCSGRLPKETTRLLFVGGDNDDLLQSQGRFRAVLMQLVLTVHFAMAPSARFEDWVDHWDGLFERMGGAHLRGGAARAGDVRTALACARANHQAFFFFHDFFVTDLDRGRGPNRQRLLEQRRAAVEAAGGTFVDLLDAFGAGAGIAWFNDFIHPSAVGHQQIGKLICDVLARAPTAPPAP